LWRSLAQLHELTGRRATMLPLLERALELDPEDPETLADLGEWYLERGDLVQAARWARTALELEPEHPAALVLMGNVLLRNGAVTEAREHAVWALRNDPAHGGALRLMASIKARQNVFLGLWWRYSTWMGSLGHGRAIVVLLGAFVLYRVVTIAVADGGRTDLAGLISMLWMAFVAYTWFGPAIFRRSLDRELKRIELERSF